LRASGEVFDLMSLHNFHILHANIFFQAQKAMDFVCGCELEAHRWVAGGCTLVSIFVNVTTFRSE
jgi:hypothetical protein